MPIENVVPETMKVVGWCVCGADIKVKGLEEGCVQVKKNMEMLAIIA